MSYRHKITPSDRNQLNPSVADHLVDDPTVRNLLIDGQIEGYRIGRRKVCIYRDSLEQYLAEQQATPAYDDRLQERLRKERQKRAAKRQGPKVIEQLRLIEG